MCESACIDPFNKEKALVGAFSVIVKTDWSLIVCSSTFKSYNQGKLTVRKPSVLSISSAASSQGQPPSSWYSGDCACSASNIINMTNIITRLFRYRHIPWFSCAYASHDIFTAPAPLFDLPFDIKLWGGYDVIRVGAVAGIICNRITCGRGYPHSCYHQNITWMCICRVYT